MSTPRRFAGLCDRNRHQVALGVYKLHEMQYNYPLYCGLATIAIKGETLMNQPSLKLVKPEAPEIVLPPDQAELVERMFHGYVMRRSGANAHDQKTIKDDLSFVRDFVRHSQKAPWDWEEADFDRWCYHLGRERGLFKASQRKYQSAIKMFLNYVITEQAFINEVRKRYKTRIKQICHSGNMIPHVNDRELNSAKPMMSKEQLEVMVNAISGQVDIEENFQSKSRYPLERDYAMFAIMFHLGVRVSEACKLDIDHFSFEAASGCMFVNITGKGSRGSGPKFRNVPILNPQAAEMLVWYLEKVRPHLTKTKHPNERAVFLSERGTRISRGSIENRFRKALILVGMDGLGLTPHSMRHGSVTSIQMEGLSTEGARRFAGHAHSSTTQLYTHVGDDFVLDQFKAFLVRQQGGQS